MTPPQLLMIAGGMLAAATVLTVLLLVAVRRALPGPPRTGPDEAEMGKVLKRAAALQSRMDDLQRLVNETDRKVESLRRLLDQASQGSLYPPPMLEPQHEAILHLRSQGLDSIDIARRLDLDVGQVELTLNLRKVPAERQEA